MKVTPCVFQNAIAQGQIGQLYGVKIVNSIHTLSGVVLARKNQRLYSAGANDTMMMSGWSSNVPASPQPFDPSLIFEMMALRGELGLTEKEVDNLDDKFAAPIAAAGQSLQRFLESGERADWDAYNTVKRELFTSIKGGAATEALDGEVILETLRNRKEK